MKVSFKYTLLFIFLFACSNLFATKYTWTGNTSTAWGTSTNWSPNGVPSTTDSVKIVTRTNTPLLAANTTVKEFDMTSGNISLGGYSLTVTNNAYFYSGTLSNGTLVLRGSYALFNGSTFNVAIDAIASRTEFSGGVFNYPSSFEQTGTSTTNGAGGCTFNAAITIKKSGASYLTMGVTSADIFNSTLKVINTATYAVQLGYNTVASFYDSLILENSSASGISIGGGNANGGGHIYNGKKIFIGTGGFTAGLLTLKNFIQTGTGQQAFATSGSAITSLAGCSFEGDLTITSPGILLKTSTFNGTTEFIRSSTSSSYSDGGNVFNGTTTFRNNATNTASFRLGVQTGDQYNGNVSFITTTGYIQPAFTGTSEFKGNVSISSSMVVFNAGAGKMLCTGSNNQTFSTTGSLTYLVAKFGVNKSSGTVTFNAPITIDSLLELTNGNIITSSNNLLTLKATGTVSGGSSMSFVNGPLKKIGSSQFKYPIGNIGVYCPVVLASTMNVTNAFVVEYFNKKQSLGSNCDSSIKSINNCSYWKVTKVNGTSLPLISLSWNNNTCPVSNLQFSTIVSWDGVKWMNRGAQTYIGNSIEGFITTNLVNSDEYYTIGNKGLNNYTLDLGPLKSAALFTLDSINTSNLLSIVGSHYYNKLSSNIDSYSNVYFDESLSDSIFSKHDSIISSLYSLNSSGIINDGDTIRFGGVYRLINGNLLNSLSLLGDSTTVFYIKADSVIHVGSNFRLNLQGVKVENVIWILNDIAVDTLADFSGILFCRKASINVLSKGRMQLFARNKFSYFGQIRNNEPVYFYSYDYLTEKVPSNPSIATLPCNIILNPGFEDGGQVSGKGDIIKATFWNVSQNGISVCGSQIPGAGNTPDLMDINYPFGSTYNNCSQSNSVGIPTNFASNSTVSTLPSSNGISNNRYIHVVDNEWVKGTLAPGLLLPSLYLLNFNYSAASCNQISNINNGCLFFSSSTSGGNITNSLATWDYGFNTSQSGWNSLTACVDLRQISNVSTLNNINLRFLNPGNGYQDLFVDDISLIKVADADEDRVICYGESVQIGSLDNCLNPTTPGGFTVSYQWTASPQYNWAPNQNTQAAPVVSPSQSTTFTLTTTIQYTDAYQTVITCFDFDQVFVEVSNLTGSITVNQNPCASSGATLIATTSSGTAPFSYQWNTGSTSNSITVSSNGVYTVTITDASGCSTVLTQNVQINNLVANITIANSPCVGQSNGQISVVMQGGLSGYSYSWSNGNVSGSGNSSQATWNISGLGAGNYTISITDGNGCTIQSNFNLVSTSGSISISNNSSNTICSGQSIQLTAIGISSPGTYSWTSNGQGNFTCSTCQSTGFSPVTSQIVNVNFTSNSGCVFTNSLSITVNQLPTVPVISSPLTNCESNHIVLVTNVNSSMAYNWVITNTNNGNVITQGTGTSFLVSSSWPTPFRIDYTVTDLLTGCSSSTKGIVYGCCEPITYNLVLKLDMSNLTWSSIYSNPAWADFVSYNPTWSSEKLTSTVNGVRYVLSINGTFTIDKDLDLQFATIEMGPLAKIIVNPGVRFLIGEGNYIHSCGQYMWDGIVTTNANGVPPSYIDIYTGNSKIEDALNAVQINSPSHLYAYQTVFNKNWNSLQFNGVSGSPNPDIFHTLLEGNRFTSRTASSLLNDEPIYLPPHAQMLPRSAIEINNVEEVSNQKLVIGYSGVPGGGDPSELTNSFSNLTFGIRVNNSSVDIHNNAFFGIREQPYIGKAKGQGACISVNNDLYAGNVLVGNSTSPYAYTAAGTIAAFSKLYCNSFLSCTFGVVAINSKGSLTVSNNTDPLFNSGLTYSTPKNYNYNFDRINYTGISTSNCKNFKLKINRNDFENCNIAINTASTSVQIGSSYSISNNTINIPNRNIMTPIPSPFYRGIVMSQITPHSQVSANIIGNNCTGQFSSCYSLIRVNNVSFINNETHVDANLSNSYIRGLWLMNSNTCNISRNVFTTLSSQVSWIPNSTGIYIDECGKNDIIENSFHKYQDHIEVLNSMTGTNFECNKFNTGLNGLIINNSYVDNQGSATSAQSNEWDVSLNTSVNIVGKNNYLQSDWYVHSVLPGILPDPIYQIPFVYSGSEPGKLICNLPLSVICGQDPCPNCRIEKWNTILDRINLIDTLTHINQVYSGVFQLLNEWAGDSTLNSDSLFESSSLNQKTDFIALRNAVCTLINLHLNYSFSSCPNFNIESSSNYLKNLYQTIGILVRINNAEDLTSSDTAFLYNLANSNSYSEGPAVFIARGIVDEWGDDYLPDLNRTMFVSPLANQSFNVFPNPTKGEITITSDQNIERILIFDLVGKLIREIKVNGASMIQIDVSELRDGVYCLKSNANLGVKRIVKIGK